MADQGPSPMRFPDGFLWGTATAAHQVEGGNHANDWWRWEQSGGILTGDSSDPACDHFRRFREDFRLLRKLGQNAHRLSIEWSRVEPAPGEFDQKAIRHYRDVLAELRENGLRPMVTLHHFTSPAWFSDRGGWEAAGAPEAWLPFVRRVADELGGLVDLWCTINEPNVYAAMGWVMGEFPPGRRGDLRGAYRVLANLRRAHEAAYVELARRTPGVPIGLAHNHWMLEAANPRSRLDRLAAANARLAMERWPLGRGRMQPVVEATSDYIGLNHYSGQLVAFDPRRPGDQLMRRFNPPGDEVSDFGWALHRGWMAEALDGLRRLGKPVYVTESGIASADDARRVAFLGEVLEEVWSAIAGGVDVRGYFHWTSIDNFEWARGYSMRFGLIATDRRTQERTVKPSGERYARIARANALVD